MVKAELHLIEEPATGKIMVPAGVTFAELFKLWRLQYAEVDRLFDRYDAESWPATASDHFKQERDRCQTIEPALWESPIATVAELVCLAELDLTYEGSEHDNEGALARAILAVLGPANVGEAPSALFASTASPRIGLTIGR